MARLDTFGRLPHVDKTDTLVAAICAYGESAQVDMAIEEMSELTKALLKYRRAINADPNYLPKEVPELIDGIREEMADVIIMLTQLLIIFGGYEQIKDHISFKTNRLEQRLKAKYTEENL